MTADDVIGARWQKSSRSGGAESCVEIAHVRNVTAVRDSKNPTGPVLTFSPNSLGAFLRNARTDRPAS